MEENHIRTIQETFSENDIPYDVSKIQNSFICSGKAHTIIFKDILIHNICEEVNIKNSQSTIEKSVRDDVERIIPKLKEKGFQVFDSWAVGIETETCNDCPAYQWVVHRTGIHPCRLFENIKEGLDDEGNWFAAPVQECIRPKTVGASYLIAREKNISEPIVGKSDSEQ